MHSLSLWPRSGQSTTPISLQAQWLEGEPPLTRSSSLRALTSCDHRPRCGFGLASVSTLATAYVALSTYLTYTPSHGTRTLGLFVRAANAPAGGAGGGSGSSGGTQACGWAYQCPQESPCCTEYGQCSAGVACLSGCNPQGSYGQGYCAPVPACQSNNVRYSQLAGRVNYSTELRG